MFYLVTFHCTRIEVTSTGINWKSLCKFHFIVHIKKRKVILHCPRSKISKRKTNKICQSSIVTPIEDQDNHLFLTLLEQYFRLNGVGEPLFPCVCVCVWTNSIKSTTEGQQVVSGILQKRYTQDSKQLADYSLPHHSRNLEFQYNMVKRCSLLQPHGCGNNNKNNDDEDDDEYNDGSINQAATIFIRIIIYITSVVSCDH